MKREILSRNCELFSLRRGAESFGAQERFRPSLGGELQRQIACMRKMFECAKAPGGSGQLMPGM
jgi:hypothetical protein